MTLSKEEYYRIRGQAYRLEDPEADIRYQNVMRWVTLEPHTSIREVGCKFAIMRDLLHSQSEHRADYMAVDIDEVTLGRIPGFNAEQFICHNINQGLPFVDATADYLLCLEVMEHIENPTFFLEEAKRVLKPEGKLIISVPNPYSWMEILSNVLGYADTEGHVASFTKQNMGALLKFAGLRLLDTKGTFTRIPLTGRLFKRPRLLRTNNFFLTRSNMFLIGRD